MVCNAANVQWWLKSVLPSRWFSDSTPVLDALLAGLAVGWALVHTALDYLRQQTRIATATDSWLDIISGDLFGKRLPRQLSENDNTYRLRIAKEIIRERCTRLAVSEAILDLTGKLPLLFETANCSDTGGYGSFSSGFSNRVGYNISGGWGSLSLPFQVFLTVSCPESNGISALPGWCTPAFGYCEAQSGYGTASNQVTNDDICRAILGVLPVGVTAWVRNPD
jgi:hypothetical protein